MITLQKIRIWRLKRRLDKGEITMAEFMAERKKQILGGLDIAENISNLKLSSFGNITKTFKLALLGAGLYFGLKIANQIKNLIT
jgi:hypothetical protein